MSPKRRGSLNAIHLKLLLTAFFWGGTFIAGRIVAKNMGPFSAAFIRFVIASIVLLVIIQRSEGKLPRVKREQIIPVMLLGLTGICLYNVFFFKGLKIIGAGRAAIIIATNPIFISLLSSCFFRERLTRLKMFGIIISVLGAVVVISKGDLSGMFQGQLGWGEGYIFCCVLSWVAFSLIGKTLIPDLSPLVLISYSSVVGTVALFGPAVVEGVFQNLGNYSLLEWAGILYLGIFGTAVGFVWYYEGIMRLGPSKASVFINFVPISAVALAFLILGEPVTPSLVTGTVFVSMGVYLTNKAV